MRKILSVFFLFHRFEYRRENNLLIIFFKEAHRINYGDFS
ncbi:hypothetical protein HMPREF1987_01381 [Peptostreptococcaceae bacterium oral taxon 113 str. W5053]|nr:hypothetical protein HMPREF1987_01381 [Peptostreptococcaceae bacterium oral taxon 113 str. W5053]